MEEEWERRVGVHGVGVDDEVGEGVGERGQAEDLGGCCSIHLPFAQKVDGRTCNTADSPRDGDCSLCMGWRRKNWSARLSYAMLRWRGAEEREGARDQANIALLPRPAVPDRQALASGEVKSSDGPLTQSWKCGDARGMRLGAGMSADEVSIMLEQAVIRPRCGEAVRMEAAKARLPFTPTSTCYPASTTPPVSRSKHPAPPLPPSPIGSKHLGPAASSDPPLRPLAEC